VKPKTIYFTIQSSFAEGHDKDTNGTDNDAKGLALNDVVTRHHKKEARPELLLLRWNVFGNFRENNKKCAFYGPIHVIFVLFLGPMITPFAVLIVSRVEGRQRS